VPHSPFAEPFIQAELQKEKGIANTRSRNGRRRGSAKNPADLRASKFNPGREGGGRNEKGGSGRVSRWVQEARQKKMNQEAKQEGPRHPPPIYQQQRMD